MDNMLVIIILFLPLLSFFIQLILPNAVQKFKVCLSIFILLISLLLSVNLLLILSSNTISLSSDSVTLFTWIRMSGVEINFSIFKDSISSIMLVVVLLISFLVHLYSFEYMSGDKRFSRYFAFLGLFTFSMNGVVLSSNLFFTFIFWELVGVSSFLLIGFWYEKSNVGDAAKKAFLVNRIGDIGMFLGIMIIFFTFGTFVYADIAEAAMYDSLSTPIITLAVFLIFMGAIGKSAQFPLHVWLPDAMEGPTHVSALIHAATMVAAGVYMTLRIFPFLTVDALHIISAIGAFTAFFASLVAISQYDIKKVLAYSTISQLGYMICAIGVGAYFAAFFHLVTHAMFKACLFLSSGSIIHSMHHSMDHINDHSKDPQDLRNMGSLKSKLPVTFSCMLISTLSLCGFPLFSGFLSKDSIIAGTIGYYHHFHGLSIIIPMLIILSAGLTSFYMFRLIFLTFFGKPKAPEIYKHITESNLFITFPLALLSMLCFAFIFTLPNFSPFSYEGWFYNLIQLPYNIIGYDMNLVNDQIHHSHKIAMYISILMSLFGFTIAFIRYFLNIDIQFISKIKFIVLMKNVLSNKFYIDEIYSKFIVTPYLNFSKRAAILDWDFYDQIFIDFWGWITLKISKLSAILDYSLLDQFIIDGFARLTNKTGKEMQSTQNGILQSYLISGVIGLLILIIIIQQLG